MSTIVESPRLSPVNDLTADTEEGAAMIEAAERCAREFADGALAHDRAGSFATEHLQALRDCGFLAAPVPAELGGGGVESIHDVVVASSRLARGDVATALGVNMHFAVLLNIRRAWRNAVVTGAVGREQRLGAILDQIVADALVFASAISEQSPQDLTRPRTTARATGDGWVIDGHKVFATMARSATVINTAVRIVANDGSERYGFALVPAGADGVTFNDDWDAVGMRASDSGSLSLRGVHLDRSQVGGGIPAGAFSTELHEHYLASGTFHAASSLGIAESAHHRTVERLGYRGEAVLADPHAMSCLADNVVDLTAMQASLELATRRVDSYFEVHGAAGATLDEAQALTASVQAAKAFICAAAQRVTDRALALTGGAGYMAAHPLAKAWRDARAGAFMHPYGANRAYDLVARTALGLAMRPERDP